MRYILFLLFCMLIFNIVAMEDYLTHHQRAILQIMCKDTINKITKNKNSLINGNNKFLNENPWINYLQNPDDALQKIVNDKNKELILEQNNLQLHLIAIESLLDPAIGPHIEFTLKNEMLKKLGIVEKTNSSASKRKNNFHYQRKFSKKRKK